MATVTERKEQVATWNGDPVLWQDYVKRVRLQYERTPVKKRSLLGAELASRLTGRAWDVTSADLDHQRLQKPDGPAYLLQFLEQKLGKGPIPDSGQRLEDFFVRLRRSPGQSMAEWSTQLRESYRRLQRALARQRFERTGTTDDPRKTSTSQVSTRGAGDLQSTPETQRRRSDVTSPQHRTEIPPPRTIWRMISMMKSLARQVRLSIQNLMSPMYKENMNNCQPQNLRSVVGSGGGPMTSGETGDDSSDVGIMDEDGMTRLMRKTMRTFLKFSGNSLILPAWKCCHLKS